MKPHLTIDGKAPNPDPPWWTIEFDQVCKGLFCRKSKGYFEELILLKVLMQTKFPYQVHPTTKEGVSFVEFDNILLFAPETDMKELMKVIRKNKKHGCYFQQVPEVKKKYRF